MNLYKEFIIESLENFYCERLEELVECEEFGDAHSIYEEFVVDGEEPSEYLFMSYLNNVC